MNVVNSSGWLEYFAGGPNTPFFAPIVRHTSELLVPTITIYEVCKRVLQQRGETAAMRSVGFMYLGIVVPLDTGLAASAARLSLEVKLPMADSIILATARAHGAILWTQDSDFEGIDGVRYVAASRQQPANHSDP